jgi:hypothetical protein
MEDMMADEQNCSASDPSAGSARRMRRSSDERRADYIEWQRGEIERRKRAGEDLDFYADIERLRGLIVKYAPLLIPSSDLVATCQPAAAQDGPIWLWRDLVFPDEGMARIFRRLNLAEKVKDLQTRLVTLMGSEKLENRVGGLRKLFPETEFPQWSAHDERTLLLIAHCCIENAETLEVREKCIEAERKATNRAREYLAGYQKLAGMWRFPYLPLEHVAYLEGHFKTRSGPKGEHWHLLAHTVAVLVAGTIKRRTGCLPWTARGAPDTQLKRLVTAIVGEAHPKMMVGRERAIANYLRGLYALKHV